jgi:hypothetical protein
MSTRPTSVVNLARRVSETERVRVYKRGRVCAHPDCATILSVYNPAKYCAAHVTEARSGRRRGASQSSREAACENCGAAFETANPHRRYCSDRCRMAAFARRKRAQLRAQAHRDEELFGGAA